MRPFTQRERESAEEREEEGEEEEEGFCLCRDSVVVTSLAMPDGFFFFKRLLA